LRRFFLSAVFRFASSFQTEPEGASGKGFVFSGYGRAVSLRDAAVSAPQENGNVAGLCLV